MLQLGQTDNRPYIHRQSAFTTPEGTIAKGKITDSQVLTERLKKARLKHRWHNNRVNLVLSSQVVYLRPIILPPMTTQELAKAMRWEAEKHLPFPTDKAVYSYTCTGEKLLENKPSLEYLLAAVPKEIADTLAEVAVRAGYNPVGIEIAPVALYRSLRQNGITNNRVLAEPMLILEIGHECTNLLVLQNGHYQFHRHLNMGIGHFYDALLSGSVPDYEAAQRRLFGKGLQAGDELTQAVSELTRKIDQSLDYWTYQPGFAESKCREIAICGGGASIPGLTEFLGEKLHMKVKLYNPLPSVNGGINHQAPDAEIDAAKQGALYSVAHGLALRGWLR
ncbi:MAG TPA: pilus assembly protein PilM [Candidatus Limnocylindrales bacterium]|nr:pilus assembly protein PilM [Candidatus Limnocylindrales bacterium]